jgi:hypothetical protein
VATQSSYTGGSCAQYGDAMLCWEHRANV